MTTTQSIDDWDSFDFTLDPPGPEFHARMGRFIGGASWRWKRANRFAVKPPGSLPDGEDKLVRLTVDWIRGTELFLLNEDETLHDFAGAALINSNPEQRLAVEARLLSGQPISHVARLIRLKTITVQTFASLFFDVVDRLEAKGWILASVLGAEAEERSSLDRIVLKQSYIGGPVVCEQWLKHYHHLGIGEDHDIETQVGQVREQMELWCLADQMPESLSILQLQVLREAAGKHSLETLQVDDRIFTDSDVKLTRLADALSAKKSEMLPHREPTFEKNQTCCVEIGDVA